MTATARRAGASSRPIARSGAIALSVEVGGGKTRRGRVHEAGSLRVRFPERRRARARSRHHQHGRRHGGRRPLRSRHRGRATARGSSSPPRRPKRSIARSGRTAGSTSSSRSAPAHGSPGCRRKPSCSTARGWRADRGRSRARTPRCCWPRAIVFGRSAWARRSRRALFDRWRVRRDGKLIYAETVRLDGAIAQTLARARRRQGRHRDRDRSGRAGR